MCCGQNFKTAPNIFSFLELFPQSGFLSFFCEKEHIIYNFLFSFFCFFLCASYCDISIVRECVHYFTCSTPFSFLYSLPTSDIRPFSKGGRTFLLSFFFCTLMTQFDSFFFCYCWIRYSNSRHFRSGPKTVRDENDTRKSIYNDGVTLHPSPSFSYVVQPSFIFRDTKKFCFSRLFFSCTFILVCFL